MKTIKFTQCLGFLMLAVSALIVASPSAYAATTNYGFVTPTVVGGTDFLDLIGANGNNTREFQVSYSDAYATNINQIYFIDPKNQSPSNIAGDMNTAFGLTGSLALSGSGSQGNALPVEVPPSFDYLSLHFGAGTVFFQFNTPVTSSLTFNSSGQGAGFSNYRAFTAPVPEPETWAMLLVGITLLGMKLHRKESSQELMVLSA